MLIRIFRKFLPKSRFSISLNKIFWPKVFLKMLTKINICFNYDQNRHFGKCWPKSRIFDNFDQNKAFSIILMIFDIFRHNFHQNPYFCQFWPKSRFLEICDQNRHISKFWPKSTFFGNFDLNQDLGKILTQIKISEDID